MVAHAELSVGAGDSRTIHGSAPGRQPAAPQPPPRPEGAQLFRAAGFISMAPRSHAPPEVLAQRREFVERRMGTNAWCAHLQLESAEPGPPWPEGEAGQPPVKEAATLSRAQRALV